VGERKVAKDGWGRKGFFFTDKTDLVRRELNILGREGECKRHN